MSLFPIHGERLPLPTLQTANLTPPTPRDAPLNPIDLERRQSDILRAQHEFNLLWQVHSLELQQAAAARMVADQVEVSFIQTSVA